MCNSSLGSEMPPKTLVTFASWEERFALGVKALVDSGGIGEILMIHCAEYQNWTAENRALVASYANCASLRINVIEISLGDSDESWKRINQGIDGIFRNVIIDITTMPREVIVFVLDAASTKGKDLTYHYATPEAYSPEWLSRDPGKPRVILGRGGISFFNRQTLLSVSVGYDIERVLHLVNFFEPSKLVAFFQTQEDMDSRGSIIARLCGVSVDSVVVDFMKKDRGFDAVRFALKPYLETHNVVLASLGPKPSAVTFYEISLFFPSVCLAYAPSNEYNRAYSTGLKQRLSGSVKLPDESAIIQDSDV